MLAEAHCVDGGELEQVIVELSKSVLTRPCDGPCALTLVVQAVGCHRMAHE